MYETNFADMNQIEEVGMRSLRNWGDCSGAYSPTPPTPLPLPACQDLHGRRLTSPRVHSSPHASFNAALPATPDRPGHRRTSSREVDAPWFMAMMPRRPGSSMSSTDGAPALPPTPSSSPHPSLRKAPSLSEYGRSASNASSNASTPHLLAWAQAKRPPWYCSTAGSKAAERSASLPADMDAVARKLEEVRPPSQGGEEGSKEGIAAEGSGFNTGSEKQQPEAGVAPPTPPRPHSVDMVEATLAAALPLRPPSVDMEDGSAAASLRATSEAGHGVAYRSYSDPEAARAAAVAETYRLNHSLQTVDFVEKQAAKWLPLAHMKMSVWDSLALLNELVDESDPDTDLPQIQHLFQTAEALRAAYPEEPWIHLVGLIHDLGKVLSHEKFGGEPQWATVGDTFPVGCAHAPELVHHEFFALNPDSANPAYSGPCGVYEEGCGLRRVKMSWGHDEYLYHVLVKAGCTLPEEALFVIRYHSFYALHQAGAYSHLLDDADRRMLPWLKRFQPFDLYSKVQEPVDIDRVVQEPVDIDRVVRRDARTKRGKRAEGYCFLLAEAAAGRGQTPYYQGLLDQYFPNGQVLAW